MLINRLAMLGKLGRSQRCASPAAVWRWPGQGDFCRETDYLACLLVGAACV